MSINFPSRLSWENFHRVIIEGLKVYAFYLAVLSLFRLFFILWLNDYWGPNTAGADILLALWRGSRLSMQTAGALTLVSFVPAFAAHYLLPKSEKYLWLGINGILLAVLSVLYMASFPYYRIYRMNFNQMLFTGMNEDWGALFWTMVDQYALPARFAGAMLLTVVLWQLLRKLLVWQMPLLPIAHWPLWGKMVVRAAFLYLVYIAVLLGIFGGSLGWQTAVDWENAGVTKDEFLNEAILDNPQAIYRAYNLNSRMLACNGLDFTMEDIRQLAAKGQTILISSHILTELEDMCDEVLILERGKILRSGAVAELEAHAASAQDADGVATRKITLEFVALSPELLAKIRALPHVTEVVASSRRALAVTIQGGETEVDETLAAAFQSHLGVVGFRRGTDLEAVFMASTTGAVQ